MSRSSDSAELCVLSVVRLARQIEEDETMFEYPTVSVIIPTRGSDGASLARQLGKIPIRKLRCSGLALVGVSGLSGLS